jgi:hypothetical protein
MVDVVERVKWRGHGTKNSGQAQELEESQESPIHFKQDESDAVVRPNYLFFAMVIVYRNKWLSKRSKLD